MAKVLCTMTDCKYCGRKSSIYTTHGGEPLFNCKKETIQIRTPHDPDHDIEDLTGKIALCMYYKVKQEFL